MTRFSEPMTTIYGQELMAIRNRLLEIHHSFAKMDYDKFTSAFNEVDGIIDSKFNAAFFGSRKEAPDGEE